jgi:arylsulfatase A-like enzyme
MLWILVMALLGDTGASPNIVILMADDLRADALGSLGSPWIQTPNLDRLVARGVVFRHAYCFGSHSPAVCLPSRNMFLSGRAYFRWKGSAHAPADGPSLPRTFREAGYDTFHSGKRGNVAVEIEKLFETSIYLQDDQERRSGEPGRAVVDHALEWLGKRPEPRRPYLMYLAFEAPHDPRVANQVYRQPYRQAEVPLPGPWLPEHPFDNGETKVRDEQLAPWPRTAPVLRQHWEDYAAVITGLDHHIGRLLDRLDPNTVIVLTSDNGLALGSHGLMGKQSLYEHSMGVPLVIVAPGLAPATTDSLVYLFDVFATLCDWAGVPTPRGLDGQSLVGVMQDPQRAVRSELLLCYRSVQRAIRDERWKLIYYPQVRRLQLFDLRADPLEQSDLSTDASLAAVRQDLWGRLRALQTQWGDDLPLPSQPPE